MADIKLKPCPFCGGYAHIDKTSSMTAEHDFPIYCEGCDIYFVLDSVFATEEDTINAWNRRCSNG